MSDQIIFAIGYTVLIASVSYYYNVRGYYRGIRDTLIVLKEQEPKLSESFINKIEKHLLVEKEAQE